MGYCCFIDCVMRDPKDMAESDTQAVFGERSASMRRNTEASTAIQAACSLS